MAVAACMARDLNQLKRALEGIDPKLVRVCHPWLGEINLLTLVLDKGFLSAADWLCFQGVPVIDPQDLMLSACRQGRLHVAKWLEKYTQLDYTHMIAACTNGHLIMAQWLRKKGVDIYGDVNGRTALLWASSEAHNDIIAWLVQEGANVRETDHTGNTCMMLACMNGHLTTAKFIYEFAPDLLHLPNMSGGTPFLYGCQEGQFDVVKWLFELNATPEFAMLLDAPRSCTCVSTGFMISFSGSCKSTPTSSKT